MRPETLNSLRSLLIDVCDRHLASGGKLVPDTLHYDFKTKSCCPITALTGDTDKIDRCKIIASFVGENISWQELGSFFEGFDGQPLFHPQDSGIFELGCELRERYLGLKNDFRHPDHNGAP
jgi:hypothetical protein